MKIAIVVGVFPALSESFILNQIVGLIQAGHQVDIYARVARNDSIIHSEVVKYNLLQKTTYIREPYTLLSKLKKCISLALKNPNPKLGQLIDPFYPEGKSFQLYFAGQAFLNKNYDIIHCHYGPNGNVFSLLKKLNIIQSKIVTTFHGYDIWADKIRNNPTVYNELKQHGDFYLAISNKVREELINYFNFAPEKIHLVPNGINLENFLFKFRKVDNNIFKILTISRLSPEKGIDQALKLIFELLKINFTNIQYQIIGAGDELEKLKKITKELQIEKYVQFLGGKNHDEIPQYIDSAHLLLVPSYIEVLPMVILEAQASGLPVLSMNVGSISEIVTKETGFLANNFNELINQFKVIYQNYNLLNPILSHARNQIEKKYDINRVIINLTQLYS